MTSRPRVDIPARRAPVSGTLTPSEWLAWVQAQVLNGTAQSAEQRQLTVAADREPIPLIYGEDRIGAKVLNVVPTGVNVLIQCLWCLAGDSINDLRYNDEALPGTFTVAHYTGAQTAPDTSLASAFAAHGISYTDALTGFMYSVVSMPQAAFSESLNFIARIRGRKLYDPRRNALTNAHLAGVTLTWPGDGNTINSIAGGTATIVGFGHEGSFSYVDFRVQGTATNPGGAFPFFSFNWGPLASMVSNAQTVAGQTWHHAAFLKRMAGTLPTGGYLVEILAADAGGSFVGATGVVGGSSLPAAAVGLEYCGVGGSGALPASTTAIGYCVGLVVPFSETVDCTLRIGLPRLWHPSMGIDPWALSFNPSLADADFLSSASYGCGKAVDWPTVITAANENDALVSGGPRRILNGFTVPGMQPVKNVSETLRTYAGCFHLPGANGVQLVPDRPASSVASYSHAAGQIAGLSRLEKRDTGGLPTVMEVVYTDTSSYPWRDDSAVASLPGAGSTIPYRLQQVRLPGVHRYAQAYREAVERLNKLNTTDLSLVLDVFDIGIRHELGDVITVADHPVGLTNKLLRVSDAPEAVERGLWRLPCVEYDPAAYSDDVATGPTYPDTGLASPATVPPDVASLSVSVLADGTRRYTIIVPANAARGSRIMVRSVAGASSSWGAMSDFFSLDYDPNVTTYYRESNLPAGAGTWSFSAKLVTTFLVESANAAVINGAVLGRDPALYGSVSNMRHNADWTDELGFGVPGYDDARALRGFSSYRTSSNWKFGRNYEHGASGWNLGTGGAWIHCATTAVAAGQYAMIEDAPRYAVIPGVSYEAHVRVNVHRGKAHLYLRWYSAAGTHIADAMGAPEVVDAGSSNLVNAGTPASAMPLLWRFAAAPTVATHGVDAAFATMIFLLEGNGNDYPYAFFQQAMLCIPYGTPTKATFTPWVAGNSSTVDGQLQAVYTRTVASTAPGVFSGVNVVDTLSFTPAVSGVLDVAAQAHMSLGADINGGFFGAWGGIRVKQAGSIILNPEYVTLLPNAGSTAWIGSVINVKQVPVVAGQQVDIEIVAAYSGTLATMTCTEIRHTVALNRKVI